MKPIIPNNVPDDIRAIMVRQIDGGKINRSHKKKLMMYYLSTTMGNVTASANEVGISRNLHYDWMRTDSNYKAAFDEMQEVQLDFSEAALFKNIQSGKEASIMFHLKTKGKKRGYIETSHSIVTPVSPSDTKNKSLDELLEILHRDPNKAI